MHFFTKVGHSSSLLTVLSYEFVYKCMQCIEIHSSLWIFHNRLHLWKNHQYFFSNFWQSNNISLPRASLESKWPKTELGSIKSKLHSREQANFLISRMLRFIERWSPLFFFKAQINCFYTKTSFHAKTLVISLREIFSSKIVAKRSWWWQNSLLLKFNRHKKLTKAKWVFHLQEYVI